MRGMEENPYEAPKTRHEHEASKSGISWLAAFGLALLIVPALYAVLCILMGVAYECGFFHGTPFPWK